MIKRLKLKKSNVKTTEKISVITKQKPKKKRRPVNYDKTAFFLNAA